MSSLIDALKQVPAPRNARGKSHPLWILLLLIIMGTIAGYRGYRPLETFIHMHYEPLCRSLGVECKRPFYSTFRRIMMGLTFDDLSDCFEQWMRSHSASLFPDNSVAGLDGKRIAQKLTDTNGKYRFFGLVSLFGVEQGVTLKVQALTETDNSELKVVETLLETLQLSGLLISMDALHTQKNITALQLVLDSANDYLVAVKQNQSKLYQHLETFERYLQPLSEHEQVSQGRGRHGHRRVKVYAPAGLDEMQWVGVQSILFVERWGSRKGKEYEKKAYYISSALTSAEQWKVLIQGHWGIENQLHWPKNTVLGEDDYRLEDSPALVNWSMIRTIVINILRLNGFQSLKTALMKLANRVDIIFSLLT